MAVHNEVDADRAYPDYLRVIMHADPEQAVIWKLVLYRFTLYLQIKGNRAASAPETVGWYLAVPPDSTPEQCSSYLGVTPDFDKTMPVSFLPFHHIQKSGYAQRLAVF